MDSETANTELGEKGANLDAKLSALRCLQRLLAKPDGKEIFQQFDVDGDGQVLVPHSCPPPPAACSTVVSTAPIALSSACGFTEVLWSLRGPGRKHGTPDSGWTPVSGWQQQLVSRVGVPDHTLISCRLPPASDR